MLINATTFLKLFSNTFSDAFLDAFSEAFVCLVDVRRTKAEIRRAAQCVASDAHTRSSISHTFFSVTVSSAL